jgi:phage shock protein A
MADNAIASRLWNLWTGFMALWVKDIEKDHPEIAYQNSIQSLTQKYAKLKLVSGSVLARRMDIESRLQAARVELTKVTGQLSAAVATAQDDLALVLIQKKNALDENIASLESDYTVARADAETAKDNLLNLKAEIDSLKAEKDQMLAKFQSASARLQIQEQLDGLSVDAEVQALAGVREHIKARVAEAQLGEELRSSDLDTRLKSLDRVAAPIAARAQLEQMKKTHAASLGVGDAGGGKTL